jgi:membrane-associated phospholipid phosphatase
VLVLASVALADVSKRLIKHLVTRSRPHDLLDHGKYEREGGGSDEKSEQSFPSGHMAGSVAAARAILRDSPGAGAACMAGAGVVGVSRMLKGEHWPLDIAAGVVVGLCAESLAHRWFSRHIPDR